MRPFRTLALLLVFAFGASAPARADITGFIGANTTPANRQTRGLAVGAGFLIVGFEFEYAYTPDDPALPASCDAGDTSVDAVISLYAPTDLTWGYQYPANRWVSDSRAKMRGFVGGAPEQAGDRYRTLSPLERVTPASPRTLLAHGGRDQFVNHGHMGLLAARLRSIGVPCETLFIPYAQHAFDFAMGGFSDQILQAAVLKFLAERTST